MRQVELVLPVDQLGLLAGAVGRAWEHVGMEAGAYEGAYAFECAFVRLDDRALTVAAELVARDVDRGTEDFSRLLILDGADGEPEARQAGHLFRHEAGRVVADVHICRDTLVGTNREELTFSLTVDSSVVVEFTDRSAFAITKASYFSEEFFITRAPTVDTLEIFDGSVEWEPDSEVRYSQSRTMFSVAALLSQ